MSDAYKRFFPTRRTLTELSAYSVQGYGLILLGFASAIITVRRLSPYEYGVYGVVFALVGYISVVLNGGVGTLLGVRLLHAPLDHAERRTWYLYAKYATGLSFFLGSLAHAALLVFLPALTVAYCYCAYVVTFALSLIALVYRREVRERALRKFIWLDFWVNGARTFWPAIGVLLWPHLSGYFLGLGFSLLFVFGFIWRDVWWRARVLFYVRSMLFVRGTLSEYKNLLSQGLGTTFEGGAASLYNSTVILLSAYYLGYVGSGMFKVLMGFFSNLSLLQTPLVKWISFHFPQRLRASPHPLSEFMAFSLVGGLGGITLYIGALVAGPWLLHVLYGSERASLAPYLPLVGLNILVTSFSVCLSTVSKLYKLVWPFAGMSLVMIALGTFFVFSPWGPRSLAGFSLLYGLWLLPAFLGSYVLAHVRIAVTRV